MRRFPQQWLVTGGCGFIGSALIHRLAAEGVDSVRVLDDLSRGRLEALPEDARVSRQGTAPSAWVRGVEVVVGPIEDPDLVRDCACGASVIVHLAANAGVVQSLEEPLRDLEVNVHGTVAVLEAARAYSVPRVVLASSAAAVGTTDPPVNEASLPRPSTPYGAGKLAGEAYAGAYAQAFGLETVSLRFGNVYGPFSGAKDSVVARFIKRWMDEEPLVVYGDGEQTRDFVYIHDLLDAVIRAATVPGAGGRTFQIATARETSVNEIVGELTNVIEAMGLAAPFVEHGPERAGDVRRSYSDTTLARSVLGWEPATSLTRGLEETIAWFRAHRSRGTP